MTSRSTTSPSSAPAPRTSADPTTDPARVPVTTTLAGATKTPPRRSGARPTKVVALFVGLAVALVVLAVVSAGSGQLRIPPSEVLGSVLERLGLGPGGVTHPNGDAALWSIRFPRVVMAVLVGAALASAGALMQGVFGNPLADPGVVGVSSGAALAACTVIVFGFSFLGSWTVAAFAFVGGLLTTLLVYFVSRSGGRTEVVTLVLTGVAVNAMCGAGIAFLTFLGDQQAREQIVFWQLGSLNGTRWQYVAVVAPLVVVGTAGVMVLARRLDLLSLGERSARHLGVDVERLRIVSVVLVALLTAAAVAFCGIIAFVGLVVPHLIRMIVGPGHRVLLPASALGGAVLLLAADLVARTAVAYADLPIGMLTALVGGPFFFWLIRKTRRSAGGWA
ncbi:ABC-type Fe3+-siderophore transport system, permease component [Sanguibacter keddieii DSM 10542]|uniref:ABC-type Fe3+-siderophore transport system, permease component n=1 Tax=Sanguibacter keddieii (strain ATCC 51767 / DSM 10542 / NCFB 3025 / ST-74) TaxID=446469 RepID=D1BCT5_SANKS|nr:iron ABC transporter permease [Sanguibacter keddieii]ACZ20933.1 ABC-type Fe3+-siderophore transport system, permease component [Sanguibacter keddieii DSM 10542]